MGARHIEAGDGFTIDLGLGYRLHPAVYRTYPEPFVWNVSLEILGDHTRPSRQRGQILPNSGGTTLTLAPGIQFIKGRNLILEASYQIPLDADLRGTQPRSTDGWVFGFRYLFD